MAEMTAGATALHREVTGAGAAGETVLFLPGGGVGRWSWRAVAAALGGPCVLVDLPEHGDSRAVGPFTMRSAADAVWELVRHIPGRVHLVGLSLGAQMIVALLAARPAAASAVLFGCSVRPIPLLGNRALLRTLFGAYAPFRNIPWLVRANRRAFGVPTRDAAAFAADTRAMTPAMLTRVIHASQTFRLPPGMDAVRAPVLIAVGEKEYGVMKRSARDLAAALPEGRAYTVAGMNHNWPLAHPEFCARALRQWIAGVPLPARGGR